MNKKNNISQNNLVWIIFIIIIIPINLSYNNINDFTFDLIHYPSRGREFLFTLPISFFLAIPFMFLGLFNFYKDNEIFLLLVFILISLSSFLLYNDYSHVLLLLKITIPILTLLGFEIFFKKRFTLIEKKNISHIIKKYNYKIALIFMIVFFISIISPFYLDRQYDWLINGITIFDYFQYFPLIFVLLLGVLATNNQRFFFLLTYILCFYLYSWTANQTFFLILILFGIYYIFNFLGSSILWSSIFISIIILTIILYPLFVFLFYSVLQQLDLPEKVIDGRFYLIHMFFNNLNFLDFLSPFRTSSEISSKFYHNEFVVIFSALGFAGVILFYFVILKRIWLISKYFPHIAVSISLYSLLCGTVITVNLHPYTFIILSFFISYYYILSKIKSQ
jgi:hypothetical protein